MSRQFFVTGTDTEVGKTQTCAGLLEAATTAGLRCMGLKPVASGAHRIDGLLRNEDALALQAAMNIKLEYNEINPYRFEPAIAPHIAARLAGVDLDAAMLSRHCQGLLERPHDFALVEGAGGWRVPLNEKEYFSAIAQGLNLPVILVVAMRLGCINHALLTAEAIEKDGMVCAGWIANCVSPDMPFYDDNLLYLKEKMPVSFLGEVPFLTASDAFCQTNNIYNKIMNNLLS